MSSPSDPSKVRLRAVATIFGGGTPDADEINWNGDVPFVTPPDLRPVHGSTCDSTARTLTRVGARRGSTIAPAGAVVVSKRAPIGYVARLSRAAAFNQGCLALVPRPGVVDSKFLTWGLSVRAGEMQMLGQGTTFLEISASSLGNLSIALPDLRNQVRISDYLDRETAQIDALIGKQEQLIETLRERRNAMIEKILLKYPLGEGPRLRWAFVEVDARAAEAWRSLPLLSVSIDWGVRRRSDVTMDLSRAEDLRSYKVCLPGDIILNRMRAFQGALGVSLEPGLVSPDYAVLRPGDGVNSHWLASVLRTGPLVAEMSSRVRGIGGTELGAVRTPRLNIADLGEIRFRRPDYPAQLADLEIAQKSAKGMDALIAKAEQFIVLAKERRSALVTAAVTGQIDVRGGV